MILSASKIKTFSSCARKYYYNYVEKIESDKHPGALCGTAVHKAIELGFQGQDPFMVYLDTWRDITQDVKHPKLVKYYTEGMDMVNKFDFSQPPPLYHEMEFNLPFPNESSPIVNIRGFMDAVYADKIYDFKSTRNKPLRGVLDNDAQFIIYRWAFTQLFGIEPQVYWYHLRTGDLLEADVSQDYKLRNVYHLIESVVAKEGANKESYDLSIGESCVFCSYRDICLGRSD